ncbi:MAG: CHAT domain-containing protein [Acidobacteriota bacterium]|nr:CHAT domain-containing protein [Acidobacteriota bacterium]
MTWRQRVGTVTGVLVVVLALASGGAAAQSAVTADERTASPYHLSQGSRSMVERAERHERLARVAQAGGDHAQAARHLAKACYARSELTIDVGLSAPACQQARTLARVHKVVDAEVSLLATEGNMRAWSLDIPGAVNRLTAAIARGAELDPSRPEGGPLNDAHFTFGAIMIEAGQYDAAHRELTFARDNCTKSGNPTCLAYAETWLCRLHTQLGNYGAARAACQAAQAAADGDVFVLMNLGWMRADLEAALGRDDASLAAWLAAWHTAQVRGGEMLWPTLMNSIADTLVRLGRLDEADVWQRKLEQANASGFFPDSYLPQMAMRRGQIAMARGRPDEAATAFTAAAESSMYEVMVGAQYGLAAARHARRDFAGAGVALEQAITRIEAGRTSITGATLRASYLSLHAKAYRELIRVRWEAEGPAAAAAALEIAEAGRARALLDALSSAQVAGAAAPTLSAAAVQATLGQDDVLVEYVSADNLLLAITVTRDHLAMTALPLAGTATDLGRRIDFFSALVQESKDETRLGPTASRLYNDVLAPALAGLPSTARNLIIAADGPLHRLPFDALGHPVPLIERWNIVTVPSATVLANRVRRDQHTGAALVVAAPATTAALDPLPAAAAEAAAIRRRVGGEVAELTGTEATKTHLAAHGLSRFAVLHFANHAVVDEERPLRSALMLAGDDRWTAEEIYRQKLGADLVVLSACSTAAGAPSPGEGVMSLSRAFLYAGAAATLATLWDVPDAPGPIFADVLYRELAAGQPLGAAAANARRELRRRGAPPRAWAAYVLTGSPGAQVGITARPAPWHYSASTAGNLAVMLLLASVVVFFTTPGRTWVVTSAAGAAAAGVAVILVMPWPAGSLGLQSGGEVDRGATGASIEPIVSHDRLVWMPVPSADEHIVEVFDATGLPIGPATTTPSPFAIPATTADGWIRVEARRQGELLARSALVRLAGRPR